MMPLITATSPGWYSAVGSAVKFAVTDMEPERVKLLSALLPPAPPVQLSKVYPYPGVAVRVTVLSSRRLWYRSWLNITLPLFAGETAIVNSSPPGSFKLWKGLS